MHCTALKSNKKDEAEFLRLAEAARQKNQAKWQGFADLSAKFVHSCHSGNKQNAQIQLRDLQKLAKLPVSSGVQPLRASRILPHYVHWSSPKVKCVLAPLLGPCDGIKDCLAFLLKCMSHSKRFQLCQKQQQTGFVLPYPAR